MAVVPPPWLALATELGERCVERGVIIVGAESCTGGLIAATITSVSGSSAWFDRGFVTYSNEAKTQAIGVPASTLAAFGAVSEQTAADMARGALASLRFDERVKAAVAFSVTGVAGPGGGTAAKPVGMVCFGFATADGVRTSTQRFDGDRASVREQSVEFVLRELRSLVTE
jgi:nicotinamide-nucleotide amidase